jgi:hypothetical protein
MPNPTPTPSNMMEDGTRKPSGAQLERRAKCMWTSAPRSPLAATATAPVPQLLGDGYSPAAHPSGVSYQLCGHTQRRGPGTRKPSGSGGPGKNDNPRNRDHPEAEMSGLRLDRTSGATSPRGLPKAQVSNIGLYRSDLQTKAQVSIEPNIFCQQSPRTSCI